MITEFSSHRFIPSIRGAITPTEIGGDTADDLLFRLLCKQATSTPTHLFRPVARIDLGGAGPPKSGPFGPKKVDILNLIPLTLLQKNPFLAHFVAKKSTFWQMGGRGASHPCTPWLRASTFWPLKRPMHNFKLVYWVIYSMILCYIAIFSR